jgi:hypothetical protein
VIKTVTTYSTPGGRILLLAPPRTARRDSYSDLLEAAWPVVRLGRAIQTELSGWTDETEPPSPDDSLELFDVIITAADPHTLTRIRPTSWSQLLSSRGVLAVITHSDRSASRFYNPTGALTRAAQQDGLQYLDHIALLQVPLKRSKIEAPAPASQPVYHLSAHADLHVFGRRSRSEEIR